MPIAKWEFFSRLVIEALCSPPVVSNNFACVSCYGRILPNEKPSQLPERVSILLTKVRPVTSGIRRSL